MNIIEDKIFDLKFFRIYFFRRNLYFDYAKKDIKIYKNVSGVNFYTNII